MTGFRVARLLVVALLGVVNCIGLVTTLPFAFLGGKDWDIVMAAGHAIAAGQSPYDDIFRWHPFMAWAALAVEPLGLLAWRLLHLAALALLPWRVALIVVLTYPFWWDWNLGNLNVFVFVAAWHAMKGRPLAFLILAVLIPRPLYLPVTAWVLWRFPEWRGRFLVIAGIAALGALGTGWGFDWLSALMRSGDDLAHEFNFGPSHIIGLWYLPIGAALAAWLTWRGRVGLASIAASPYLLPYYGLMGLLELRSDAHDPKRVREVVGVRPVDGDDAQVRGGVLDTGRVEHPLVRRA